MGEHLPTEIDNEEQRKRDEEAAERFRRSRGLLPVPEIRKLDTSKYQKKGGTTEADSLDPTRKAEHSWRIKTPGESDISPESDTQ